MHLVPTQEEVVQLLRQTGALRDGFFQYPNGLYSNHHLQMALAFRYYQYSKILSVGLSRLIRANAEIRAIIPQLSIVTPATGGLPVAFGVCEALRAHQVYWAERDNEDEPQRLRQFVHVDPGEKVLLVDDILRTGKKLLELRDLVTAAGAEVVGLAVVVYQPNPQTPDFSPLPMFSLCKLESQYCEDRNECAIPEPGQEPVKVWV